MRTPSLITKRSRSLCTFTRKPAIQTPLSNLHPLKTKSMLVGQRELSISIESGGHIRRRLFRFGRTNSNTLMSVQHLESRASMQKSRNGLVAQSLISIHLKRSLVVSGSYNTKVLYRIWQ